MLPHASRITARAQRSPTRPSARPRAPRLRTTAPRHASTRSPQRACTAPALPALHAQPLQPTISGPRGLTSPSCPTTQPPHRHRAVRAQVPARPALAQHLPPRHSATHYRATPRAPNVAAPHRAHRTPPSSSSARAATTSRTRSTPTSFQGEHQSRPFFLRPDRRVVPPRATPCLCHAAPPHAAPRTPPRRAPDAAAAQPRATGRDEAEWAGSMAQLTPEEEGKPHGPDPLHSAQSVLVHGKPERGSGQAGLAPHFGPRAKQQRKVLFLLNK